MAIWNRGASKPNQPNNQNVNAGDNPPVVVPPVETSPNPPAVTPPQFVTVEQFNSLNESINSLKDNMLNMVGHREPTQPVVTPTPPVQIEDVSDDDYERAVAGEIQDKRQAAQIIRKRHNADIQRATQPFQQQLNELQNTGLSAITGLTKAGIEQLPHYKTYKKEIDAAINQLPPAARVNAENLKGVYQFVVGQHHEEILQAEKEAWIRQQQQTPDTTTTTTLNKGRGNPARPNQTQANQNASVPDPVEVLPQESLSAIQAKYGILDVDRFARSQGCKGGWEEYYNKYYKKIFESEGNA